MQYVPTVDQRITILTGFAEQHRHGTDLQISTSADVLLTNLAAGELISVSLERAEAAFTAVRADDVQPPIVRHFDTVAVQLDACQRAA